MLATQTLLMSVSITYLFAYLFIYALYLSEKQCFRAVSGPHNHGGRGGFLI